MVITILFLTIFELKYISRVRCIRCYSSLHPNLHITQFPAQPQILVVQAAKGNWPKRLLTFENFNNLIFEDHENTTMNLGRPVYLILTKENSSHLALNRL